jgi:superfamily II DNA or RNA helicase
VLDPSNWHADHIVPHSKGGDTDVLNGQALCPTCNLKKGNRVTNNREWQNLALQHYAKESRRHYLLVATPAAGKTTAALLILRYLLEQGTVRRVLVVVHTNYLKRQWKHAASRMGIQLETGTKFGARRREERHYVGAAITYQQLKTQAEWVRFHNGEVPTLVIFDEVHHLGDNIWGEQARKAVETAERILSLSGTPFRTDSGEIPFVTYENSVSKPDFQYTYAQSLRDGYCRDVYFPSFEGTQTWMKYGEKHSAAFDEELKQDELNDRLRTAINHQGDWIREVIASADTKLDELREAGDARAAGLILAEHKYHATKLHELIPGSVLVYHDLDDALAKIEAFTTGDARWLIAIRMISEGIDIPRLRTLIYATTSVTELFFRQAAGRIMRGSDDAYFYIPKDERLVRFAQDIQEERNQELGEELADLEHRRQLDEENEDRSESSFEALSSEGIASDIIAAGEAFAPAELEIVRRYKEKYPALVGMSDVEVAKFIRDVRREDSTAEAIGDSQAATEPLEDRLEQLRTICNRKAAYLVVKNGKVFSYKDVGKELCRRQGCRIRECNEDQLIARIGIVEDWLANGFQSTRE